MSIRPKSEERLLAETAAYADSQSYPHDAQLAEDLGRTATALLNGQSITTEQTDYRGEMLETREHTPGGYVQFLREADEGTRANIAFLTDKMQAYAEYRASIEVALEDASPDSEHYLGKGSHGGAFWFEHDGRKFAVKQGGVSYVDVPAYRRAENIDGISHMIAVDIDKGISVMNLVPGIVPGKMSREEMEAVPEEHIAALVDKTVELFDVKVAVDPKPTNFLYDKGKGFGIIDYQDYESRNASDYTKAEQVMELSRVLLQYHTENPPSYGEEGYDDWALEWQTHRVVMMNRLLDVLERDHPEILEEAAQVRGAPSDTIGNVYRLPEGQLFEDFKSRVIKLGLSGEEPMPPVGHAEHDAPVDADVDGDLV